MECSRSPLDGDLIGYGPRSDMWQWDYGFIVTEQARPYARRRSGSCLT